MYINLQIKKDSDLILVKCNLNVNLFKYDFTSNKTYTECCIEPYDDSYKYIFAIKRYYGEFHLLLINDIIDVFVDKLIIPHEFKLK